MSYKNTDINPYLFSGYVKVSSGSDYSDSIDTYIYIYIYMYITFVTDEITLFFQLDVIALMPIRVELLTHLTHAYRVHSYKHVIKGALFG